MLNKFNFYSFELNKKNKSNENLKLIKGNSERLSRTMNIDQINNRKAKKKIIPFQDIMVSISQSREKFISLISRNIVNLKLENSRISKTEKEEEKYKKFYGNLK